MHLIKSLLCVFIFIFIFILEQKLKENKFLEQSEKFCYLLSSSKELEVDSFQEYRSYEVDTKYTHDLSDFRVNLESQNQDQIITDRMIRSLIDSQSLTEAGKVDKFHGVCCNILYTPTTGFTSVNSLVTFASIARNQMMRSSGEPSDSFLLLTEDEQIMSSYIFSQALNRVKFALSFEIMKRRIFEDELRFIVVLQEAFLIVVPLFSLFLLLLFNFTLWLKMFGCCSMMFLFFPFLVCFSLSTRMCRSTDCSRIFGKFVILIVKQELRFRKCRLNHGVVIIFVYQRDEQSGFLVSLSLSHQCRGYLKSCLFSIEKRREFAGSVATTSSEDG
jgi:hypothetical protein